MKKLIPVAALLALTACVSPTLEPSDDSRDHLAGDLIADDYHFDFQRQCFCLQEAVQPVTITVVDGQVARVVSRDSGAEVTGPIDWPTMAQILDEVKEAEARGDLTEVRYSDQELPVYVEIGSLAADAGVIYEMGRVLTD